MNKIKLENLKTYIYIDSSNIRNALKVSHIDIDFGRLYKYLKNKYPKLQCVKYFEGIDKKDRKKVKEFKKLGKVGYEIRTLSRKAYKNSAKYRTYKCFNCKEKNTVEILKESKTFKSNIDVYLCSELMGDLLNVSTKSHAIILTCDGDYAEMIRNVLERNKDVYISVLATPFTEHNNYLSSRLKELNRIERYNLINILSIKDRISKKGNK